MEAIHQPQGMILVTGPTGSRQDRDPLHRVEHPQHRRAQHRDGRGSGGNQPGRHQSGQREPPGRPRLRSALRSFLRQDPDVVMVGEIRDLETAEIAIKAHRPVTWCCRPCTRTRARNPDPPAQHGRAGFQPGNQRQPHHRPAAGRRLCPPANRSIDVPKEALLAEGFTEETVAEGFEVFEANPDGCDKCKDGYKGRVGIYEVVKITPELSRIIMEDGNSMQLAEQAAVLGFNDLRDPA